MGDLVANHAAEHPASGWALSDFGNASTAALLRDVVRDGQIARDLRTDLDASAAALASLDTYLGTLYRWATRGGNLRQQLLPVLDTVLTGLLPPAERGVNGSSG